MGKKTKRALNLIVSNDYFRGAIQNIAIKNIGGVMSFVATDGHIMSIVPMDSFENFEYPDGAEILEGKLISKEIWKIISVGNLAIFRKDSIKMERAVYTYECEPNDYPDVLSVIPDLNKEPDFVMAFNPSLLNILAKASGYDLVQIRKYGHSLVVKPYSKNYDHQETDSGFNMAMTCRVYDLEDNVITKSIKKYQKEKELKEEESRKEKENAGV